MVYEKKRAQNSGHDHAGASFSGVGLPGKRTLTMDLPAQEAAGSLQLKPAKPAGNRHEVGHGATTTQAPQAAPSAGGANSAQTANATLPTPEDESAEALLIAFPDYKIETETFLGKVGGLGHAGVLLIRKDGVTRYYEYGRYPTNDGTKGKVRKKPVPNVVIGSDGKATPESLEKVLAVISTQSGQGGRIDAAYFQNVNYQVMESYAQAKLKESNPGNKEYDQNRKPYKLTDNNCATFAEDVITQDNHVDKPWIAKHTPINTVSEYQEEGNATVKYDPKADKGMRLSIGEFDEDDAKVKQ